MSEYNQKSPSTVRKANILDDDFLSEHLGQLLVRQPMSPKSPVSNQHDLPTDFAKGSTEMRKHASQSQMSKSRFRNSTNEIDSPRRNTSSIYANTLGVTTPEVTFPCDELFTSFFTTPKATERQLSEGRSGRMSRPGPASVSMSTSMSTSFGRKQRPNRGTLSRCSSDRDSTTSFSSLSQQQDTSRRASETATQPSNESGELEQLSPETPPEGIVLAPISSCDESEEYDTQSTTSSIPASSSASFGFQQYGNHVTTPSEEETWQIFKEGGVIEPPEAIEVDTIARKDVQDANLLHVGKRPTASLRMNSSQASSRYTSMTSSRFQSYRSTLSSVPTEMEVHNEDSGFIMDSRRTKAIVPQPEEADKITIAKQLAARSNSITLVPTGDDGRTFVFVSQETENDNNSPIRALRRNGHTV